MAEQIKMKAVVTYAPHDYRLELLDIPSPPEGGMVIKVESCGICAGDAKAYAGGERFWGGGEFARYIEPPCVPGHEFCGRVHALGAGATGFAIGERVIAEQLVPCYECAYCLAGQRHLCDPHDVFGFKRYLNGGCAEYAALPKKAIVHRVPESLSSEYAMLIEPLACAMHAVDRGSMTGEDFVVISGGGTLGLLMTAYAATMAPKYLVSLEPVAAKRALALSLGASAAFDPQDKGLSAYIGERTGGMGCSLYIDAAGHPQSVVNGLALIKKGGKFVEFSVFTEKTLSDWSVIGDAKELCIYGSSLSPGLYPKAIEYLVSGRVKPEGVVSRLFGIDEYKQAFAATASCSRRW